MGKWYFVYTHTDPMSGMMSIRDEDSKTELQPGTEAEVITQGLKAWARIQKGGFENPRSPRVVVEHASELPCQVFINLPGGLSGNKNPDWNKVVIVPSNPRTEYQPSASGQVVVSGKDGVYLKPVGGDKASAYFKLWIEDGGLAFMGNPLAPLVFSMDIFSTKGYALDKLAEVLPKQTKPPVMIKPIGDHKIPVFAINSVDVGSQTATITLDANVEVFNPDDYPDGHRH